MGHGEDTPQLRRQWIPFRNDSSETAPAFGIMRITGTVLDHIETISELDLDGVEPTSHVVELENVLREDVPRPSLPREKALEQAPDSDGSGFRVPSPGA